jgi:hypothetical protein
MGLGSFGNLMFSGGRRRFHRGFGFRRVSGNGTGVVWQFDVFGRIQLWQGAHQDEVGESALKDPMEPRLVAVHEFEGRLGGD